MIIPNCLEVRDKTGQLRAVLSPSADGLKDVIINAELNDDSVLTFWLPMTSEKWTDITPESRIIVGGREFVLLSDSAIIIERDKKGAIWGKVAAGESWTLLSKVLPTIPTGAEDLTVTILSSDPGEGGFPAGSAGSALYRLLQGTGWSVGTVDVSGVHDLETEKKSVLENISEVQKTWGGWLVWDSLNKTVSLRDDNLWQNYTGFQIRYAKNLKGVQRQGNYELVTRLYPFGQDGLDISSVNGGVKYLENFSYTTEIYSAIYENQDIDDPVELKAKGEEVLASLCRPRYSYIVNLLDLRTLPQYQHEDFQLGDMVDVIDEGLSINVRARLIKHKYNVFRPWECEVIIGEPVQSALKWLRNSQYDHNFIQRALKPNPGTNNLLKGFINTFSTQINSANGKLIWNDSTLEAIEIDANGAETGKRVRITPGGIGISTDGGQTYVTAMTGSGVLANTIICSALYALTTEDGYTKLTSSGLEVWDNQATPKKRLHAGQYTTGKFGLELRDKTGNVVILDEDGILQTWQDGRADNVDSSHGLVLNVYLPSETRSIHKAILRFRLQAFRAYETGAASGGAGTTTSASGGGTTVTSAPQSYTLAGGYLPADWMYDNGSHNHGGSTGNALTSGTYWTDTASGHMHSIDVSQFWHSHSISTSGSHAHARDTAHKHNVTISSHTHDVDIPSHVHGLNFGIYESTTPQNVTVTINGVDRTAALGGPFNADQNALDISAYMVANQWNTIVIGSSRLGRLDASVFIQARMGV